MLTVAQALQSNAPLDVLEQAMNSGLWEGLDLAKPMLSGAPLLAHWWFHQLTSPVPQTALVSAHWGQVARLGWRLVERGFDIRQSWHWVAPSGAPVSARTSLRDVFLDSNHKSLIVELERRWGSPWTARDIEWRPLTPSEMVADGQVCAQPRLIYHLLEEHLDRAKWLLSKGVDPNLVDASNQTALFNTKEPAVARRLLARGASLDVVDCFGRTPLECWAEMSLTHGPAKVFMVAVSIPDKVSAPVLEKALRTHLRSKSPLARWARPVLEQIKPRLSTPSVYKSQSLLEAAIGQAWNGLKIHDPTTFRWLLDHTPGKTRVHAWGSLAWQVLGTPEGTPTPARVRSWIKLLSAHQADPCSPTQHPLAAGRTAIGLLELLPEALPMDAGVALPSSQKWIDSVDGGPSLMSQVMAVAEPLMHEPPLLPPSSFCSWIQHWASVRPLPADTLEPLVRLLMVRAMVPMETNTAWSSAQPPTALTESPAPSTPQNDRQTAQSSLAWCINRHVSDVCPGSQWPVPASLWKAFQDRLAVSPPAWKAWGSALEAARLDKRLMPAPALASPRSRM